MTADWLATLFSVDGSTVVVIGTLCGAGTWVLRNQLFNPLLGFAIQPLLTMVSVSIFALLQASGLIEPMILTDKIKGIMAATMIGHGIGLAVGLLVLVMMSEKAVEGETTLTERQKRLTDRDQGKSAPVQRMVRRNYRESLR